MKIYTSISSSLDEREKLAIESWSKYFDVISVNSKEEIDLISKEYPKVKFIESSNCFEYLNKKLAKLNSILDEMERCDTEICCIINSDIILNKDISKNHIIKLISYAKTGLVISTRFDFIDELNCTKFTDGYDFFMFHKRNINLIRNENYVIGMPWWDYWIPIKFFFSKKKVYHINNKFILHKKHNIQYDDFIYKLFADKFLADILESTDNDENIKNNSDSIYNLAKSVKYVIEKHSINIEI